MVVCVHHDWAMLLVRGGNVRLEMSDEVLPVANTAFSGRHFSICLVAGSIDVDVDSEKSRGMGIDHL